MFTLNVNWLAVVVATVAQMALGFLWYSPILFARQWIVASGLKESDLGDPGPAYALTVVGAFVEAFVVALFVGATGAKTLTDGALVGLVAGIGFIATAFGAEYIFNKRGMNLYLITVGYQVLGLVVMGAILGAWR